MNGQASAMYADTGMPIPEPPSAVQSQPSTTSSTWSAPRLTNPPHALGCPCTPNFPSEACSPCVTCGRLLSASVWRVWRDLDAHWSGQSLYDQVQRLVTRQDLIRAHPERRRQFEAELSDDRIGELAIASWVELDPGDLVAAVRHAEACDDPGEYEAAITRGRAPRVYVLETAGPAPIVRWWMRIGKSKVTTDYRTVDRAEAAALLQAWRRLDGVRVRLEGRS